MNKSIQNLQEGTIYDIAFELQKYINNNWKEFWDSYLPETQKIFIEKHEGPAYAFYSTKLFSLLKNELNAAGLTSTPDFPGDFQQSIEQGPEEKRNRSFWCILYRGNNVLGTLVTHIIHDHTRLRLPTPPHITSLHEIDFDTIRKNIRDDINMF